LHIVGERMSPPDLPWIKFTIFGCFWVFSIRDD
jgi:hypothetical protein